MRAQSAPVVDVRRVTAGYDGRAAIENVDLTVLRGEFLGLVGPNGGGKSTLLKVVLGLLPPMAGTVRLFGGDPEEARRRVGYVTQYAMFRRDFPISVEDVVLTGRLGCSRGRFGYDRADRSVVRRCLEAMEASDLAGRPVGALSGGQFQRVLIARALATEPELLILDEPTANIDPRIEKDLFELLRGFNRRMTIIVVTHDIGFVSQYVGRVACLNRTLICHTAEPLDAEILERLYGRPLRAVDHHTRG